MNKKINIDDFIKYDSKVTNLSIGIEDLKDIMMGLKEKDAKDFLWNYFLYQATGRDVTDYDGLLKVKWDRMIKNKLSKFMKKHMQKEELTIENAIELFKKGEKLETILKRIPIKMQSSFIESCQKVI